MTPALPAARQRLARARSTPFDPAWLLERHLTVDIAEAISSLEQGVVIDVGCGGRPYEEFVPSGARYIGLDLTPTLGSWPDCWARADAIPIAGGAAALVLCTQVLEHLPDPHRCVAEIARVLAPGGRLVLTAPQTWNLHEAPHDYYRFTRYGLEHLCVQAGLEVVDIRPQGGLGAALGLSILMYVGTKALGGDAQTTAELGRSWLRALLRWPLVLHNVAFALLDGWRGRGLGAGVFAVNHLIVAAKPAAASQTDREARSTGA